MGEFFDIATRRDVMFRAAKIAAVVGFVIAVINHGDKIAMGGMLTVDWWKCALTFFVPYGVSTYSQVEALRGKL